MLRVSKTSLLSSGFLVALIISLRSFSGTSLDVNSGHITERTWLCHKIGRIEHPVNRCGVASTLPIIEELTLRFLKKYLDLLVNVEATHK